MRLAMNYCQLLLFGIGLARALCACDPECSAPGPAGTYEDACRSRCCVDWAMEQCSTFTAECLGRCREFTNALSPCAAECAAHSNNKGIIGYWNGDEFYYLCDRLLDFELESSCAEKCP